MKKLIVILALITVLTFSLTATAGVIYFDDGLPHTIDDITNWRDTFYLDNNIANDPGTHVNMLSGGEIKRFKTYNNSSLAMTGGLVREGYEVRDSSNAHMVDGILGQFLWTFNNAQATVSGGFIGYGVTAYDNSTLTVAGGIIGQSPAGVARKYIDARDNGTVYIDGTGLVVTDLEGNTYNLSYGDKLTDYASLVTHGYTSNGGTVYRDYYVGQITGILADGSALDIPFEIHNDTSTAEIYIVPEPCTLLVLGIGAITIRKRKYSKA